MYLRKKRQLFDFPDQELERVFVELPKFNQKLEKWETITDKFVDFFKEALSLEKIPSNLKGVAQINQALSIPNQANFK